MSNTDIALLQQIQDNTSALDCNPPLTAEWVQRLADHGAIARLGPHRYTLTDAGKSILQSVGGAA